MHRIVLAIAIVSMLILCFAVDARPRGSRPQGRTEARFEAASTGVEL